MTYTDFKKAMASNRAFANQFKGCETVEALVEAAAARGYSFTAEDVRNHTELLPEELAMAYGGVSILGKNAYHNTMIIGR